MSEEPSLPEREVLERPKSLTPNEDAPPAQCMGCGRRNQEWEWLDDQDAWRCTGCRIVTTVPRPSEFYKCADCGEPFRERFPWCRQCGSDWSGSIKAQSLL